MTRYIAIDQDTRKYLTRGDHISYGLIFVAVVDDAGKPMVHYEREARDDHRVYAALPPFVGVEVIEDVGEAAA
jgi:hypothetical protein